MGEVGVHLYEDVGRRLLEAALEAGPHRDTALRAPMCFLSLEKLDVDVLGQKLIWETGSYEPTLHLPQHPRGQWALAAFLRC